MFERIEDYLEIYSPEREPIQITIPDILRTFLLFESKRINNEGKDPEESLKNPFFKSFLLEITDVIYYLNLPVFFKLSTRSTKDVYSPVHLNNTEADLLLSNQRLMKWESKEILLDILKSKRAYEDLTDNEDLSLWIFPWNFKASPLKEFRLFIRKGELICAYLIFPEFSHYYSPDRRKKIEDILKDVYIPRLLRDKDAVVDIWIYDDDKIEPIEINPYDETTETGPFTWEEINNKNEFNLRWEKEKIKKEDEFQVI